MAILRSRVAELEEKGREVTVLAGNLTMQLADRDKEIERLTNVRDMAIRKIGPMSRKVERLRSAIVAALLSDDISDSEIGDVLREALAATEQKEESY